MPQTAKLFKIKGRQAVKLPANCCFDSDEVYITKDPITGDVVLSEKPKSWDGLFKLIKRLKVQESIERDNDPLVEKDRT